MAWGSGARCRAARGNGFLLMVQSVADAVGYAMDYHVAVDFDAGGQSTEPAGATHSHR